MTPPNLPPQERLHAVRRVLWVVLALNLSVTMAKILLGLVTGALAAVADGFHSLVDSSSNLIGLAALRWSARPADEEHPYGYHRYETLGALAIGVLMFVSAWEIGREVVQRLLTGTMRVIPPWTAYAMALTFPINLGVTWWESRRGRALQSEILLADAAHTRADLLVTATVVAALLGTRLGYPWLDPAVACVVTPLIVRQAWGILRDAARWLADARVADPSHIAAVAEAVPGVLNAHRIRSRGKPGAAFVDLHIYVPPGMSTEQAHAIATEVEERLKSQVTGVVEALVHVEPARSNHEPEPWAQTAQTLRRLADGLGLGLHELHLHAHPEGGVTAEMHLEFTESLTLAQAHQRAEAFRRRALAALPQLREVVTHLEPLAPHIQPGQRPPADLEAQLLAYLHQRMPTAHPRLLLHATGQHLHATVRIILPGDTPLEEAHTTAEALQRDLLHRFPQLQHVVVETLPTATTHAPTHGEAVA